MATRVRVLCSNCRKPFHGVSECKADTPTKPNIDQMEFVKRIRTQADWIESWDTQFFDQLTVSDLDGAIRQFMANVERALKDVRRRNT